MSDPRTFALATPHIEGADVRAWQEWIVEKFRSWSIAYPLTADGDYGQATRAATASLCRAWGIESAAEAMAEGVTPWLRIKLRDDRRSDAEEALFQSAERVEYRRALRAKYDTSPLCSPIAVVLQDSWGWHPGVHDGIDLICLANAPLHAICNAKVIRADPSGWWGLGAPADPVLKAKGDGIIIIRALVDAGPIRKGMNLCYGHAEGATVQEGQTVQAGDVIGKAGFANAWHVHFMVNDNDNDRGVGDRDPKPILDYVKENS